MKIQLAFASSPDLWAWGYGRGFQELGFTALVLGPIHIQFECDLDKTLALETPWSAARAWLIEAARRWLYRSGFQGEIKPSLRSR